MTQRWFHCSDETFPRLLAGTFVYGMSNPVVVRTSSSTAHGWGARVRWLLLQYEQDLDRWLAELARKSLQLRAISELASDAGQCSIEMLCLEISTEQQALRWCHRTNVALLNWLLAQSDELIEVDDAATTHEALNSHYDSCSVLLHHVAKDWSSHAPHPPHVARILEMLDIHVPNRADVKILVPGAGMCALALELLRRGFTVEACDSSLPMLLAVARLLGSSSASEGAPAAGPTMVHPYLAQRDNLEHSRSRLQGFVLKPADQRHLPPQDLARLSLVHAGFVAHYREAIGVFDVVVTSFFLDCVPQPLDAIRVIVDTMRPGALWLHFGPLKFAQHATSTAYSANDVVVVAEALGLTIIERSLWAEQHYLVALADEMHRSEWYTCLWLMAQKPAT